MGGIADSDCSSEEDLSDILPLLEELDEEED